MMEELRKNIRELKILAGRWLRIVINRRGTYTSTMIIDLKTVYNLVIEEPHDGTKLCKFSIFFGKRSLNIIYSNPNTEDEDDEDEDENDWWGDEAQLEAEKDMQKIFTAMRHLSE
ncbi:hypothetical protein [Microscilla marina]|uniref:Uncharacterized protein n=1 Tax=Microscilla marina ATCC 23134 TaxID=313606 RepID=A1ZDN2_MICM2|nr:hypothetical protein [Microscilla marina]EAY31771.1 hypothetical protein M23134_05277 [Microscilla marina ATCC 23134]